MTTLDPRLLLQGYAMGIFPMADSRTAGDVFWVEKSEFRSDRFLGAQPFARTDPSLRVHGLQLRARGRILQIFADPDIAAFFAEDIERLARRPAHWVMKNRCFGGTVHPGDIPCSIAGSVPCNRRLGQAL